VRPAARRGAEHHADRPSAWVWLIEIAARAGYAPEFSFAKAFKRTFGIAPGAHRGQPNGIAGLGSGREAATSGR
jgi:AraC-like DNA-binding protein